MNEYIPEKLRKIIQINGRAISTLMIYLGTDFSRLILSFKQNSISFR